MRNAYISRDVVHEWSEAIGQDPNTHQTALTRLLKQQRRLTRFLEQNREAMDPGTAGVATYLYGVVARIFDLAGGRLRGATWAQVHAASARVQGVVGDLLPADDGFAERVRAVAWRAQPHILDEALMALFERESEEEEDEVKLDDAEALKVFFLMWVAIEVLDVNWKPPGSFSGETAYTHVAIAHSSAGST